MCRSFTITSPSASVSPFVESIIRPLSISVSPFCQISIIPSLSASTFPSFVASSFPVFQLPYLILSDLCHSLYFSFSISVCRSFMSLPLLGSFRFSHPISIFQISSVPYLYLRSHIPTQSHISSSLHSDFMCELLGSRLPKAWGSLPCLSSSDVRASPVTAAHMPFKFLRLFCSLPLSGRTALYVAVIASLCVGSTLCGALPQQQDLKLAEQKCIEDGMSPRARWKRGKKQTLNETTKKARVFPWSHLCF